MISPRAILFDLDGTLVDANPDLAEAVRRTLADVAEPPRSDEEVGRFVGKGVAVLVERSLNTGRRQHAQAEIDIALARFMVHYGEVNGQKATIYPYVREILEILRERRLPCACVTNKSNAFTLSLLKSLQLAEFFACVVGGDTLPQKKPEPEPLLYACQSLGVAPEQALMIGDSENDALAARRASVPVWLMRGGYSEGIAVDSIDCDGLLSSFAELPALLGMANSG